jgi:hypothetical protein
MTQRFIYFKKSAPHLAMRLFEFLRLVPLCPAFIINWQNTLFDVGRSMFDVRCSLVYFPFNRPFFLADGWAEH